MPECGYNQIREEALKRQMDALQDNNTASLADAKAEKIASTCRKDIEIHGPSRHVKHRWEDFLTQQ